MKAIRKPLGAVIAVLALTLVTGCQNVQTVLQGASHACGSLHVEGYVTDSQGDVKIIKAPADWTPEQIQQFCP